MRKHAKKLIIIGLVLLFSSGGIMSLMEEFGILGALGVSESARIHYGNFFLGLSVLLILVGLFIRISTLPHISENPTSSQPSVGPQPEAQSILEKTFTSYRRWLYVGVCSWVLCLFPMVLVVDLLEKGAGGLNMSGVVAGYLLALPLAISCLLIANSCAKKDLTQAVFSIKIPFQFLVAWSLLVVWHTCF